MPERILIFAGSALMIWNIVLFSRFGKKLGERGDWQKDRPVLRIPLVLLVLFLIGYLATGIFGKPDLVIAGILFGGSLFVYLIIGLLQRFTDKIRHEEELSAKLAAAEEANRAKTFFLSHMSHDIRTPLNAVIGYTAIAREEDTPPEEMRALLGKIENAGTQLLGIINDVLEMSRIETGNLELEPVPLNLKETLCGMREVFEKQMEQKNIRFEGECVQIEDEYVLCDGNRLNRVLLNLISNAYKFTPEGGKVSVVFRQTGREDETASFEIRVKDTGRGMSPEFVTRLFEPFEREYSSTEDSVQGTGLGLSITKSIVDRMGGTIDVETAPGRGTEFIVRLAFPVAEPEEAAAPDPETESEIPDFSGLRLLLAEDNAVNREIAVHLLVQAGFTVDTAENGLLALEMLEAAGADRYAAVLMDVQMPVMDGYTATRRIRALPDPLKAGVPVIAMTANAFREDRQAAEEAGMDGHIAKPVDRDVMLRTIGKVLHGR